MPRNQYFTSVESTQGEQQLMEGLLVEFLQIYGADVWYLPRTRNNPDKIYGADDISSFDSAYQIEMYISSVNGFGGRGQINTSFGLEERDQMSFIVSRQTFQDFIGNVVNLPRPREGDLIWVPMIGKPFEIRYVEPYQPFYQFGQIPLYSLTCELHEYSMETFNTGIPEIDAIQMELSLNLIDWGIFTENGLLLTTESGIPLVTEGYNLAAILPVADNDAIQTEADTFLDFTEIDPLSGGTY